MSYGLDARVGICFQNSFGTALTNSIHWLPFISEGLETTKEPLISANMTGRFDEGQLYEGVNEIAGTIETEANPIALGAVMKAFFGAPTTVQSTGIYAHTFKPATSDFDLYSAKRPVTIVKNLADGGSAHQYYDMGASKFSLAIANGELLKCSVDFQGGKYAQIAAPAATLPSGLGWTWDVTSVTIATSAQTTLRELSIDIEEGTENKHVLGTAKTPGRWKRTGPRVTNVSGTIVFDNQNEYQQFLSQSERELIVNLKGTAQIQSGYYETLKIQLPSFRYMEFAPAAGGPEEIEVGFSGKGIYSTTSATAIQITLVNTQPTY
jgi:hypothetical protein